MNTVTSIFKEFHTMDIQGNDITPKTNVLTFSMKRKNMENGQEIVTEQRHTDETIMSSEDAARYTINNVFGNWHPEDVIKQVEKTAKKLKKRL